MRTPYRTLIQEESRETYEILMCDSSHVLVELFLLFLLSLTYKVGCILCEQRRDKLFLIEAALTCIIILFPTITLLCSYT